MWLKIEGEVVFFSKEDNCYSANQVELNVVYCVGFLVQIKDLREDLKTNFQNIVFYTKVK